ncbi:Carboxyl-terminal PDZ ligand of neuronal nitric oxide synthase protein [Geodia barretti]|uniref:Carboxyl-terminal PDZ ligand of neuronal nitric oxide synthase protein n=1 Tax=Geodia barretti TaxID=519541 RepID=A0AA35T128_GEOBA|nr:Carboxyl-terminal PDZ ligand of neuronal nitric oxide synthase protein [Geodia barretti]
MSLDRGSSTRISLKSITKRLGVRSKDYSKVEDLYDTRVPLHNEDAFTHGLKFKAKFIGSLEISRPTCKVDIITAMRRIRYEFKVKGIRKIRSNILVSTQGVKVIKRKRKRSRKRYTEEQLFIMQHPIYRIFYVSHDSQDMKIFSYISRELPSSTFRCNVFKAYKKNMALHIVRSLGQAFDVCHRLNPRPKKTKKEGEEGEGEGEKKAEEGEGTADNGDEKAELGADLSAGLKEISLEEGGKKTEPAPQVDLMGLDFDPFVFNFETPGRVGATPNGGPQNGFDYSSFPGGGGGGEAAGFPPLMVSNNPSGFPDLPAGSNSAQTQLQLMGRPRPRPAGSSNQQNIIQENPFTDTLRTGSASPTLSIGEAIDGPVEKMISNPFMADPGGQQAQQWEMYRQQMAAHMQLMQEQLKQEKAARIESQASLHRHAHMHTQL